MAVFQKHITQEKTDFGRGGMMTKFTIAKKLVSSGIAVYIVNGRKKNILCEIIDGRQVGTRFIPLRKTSGLKRRLAYSEGLTMGAIIVNKCVGDMLIPRERLMSLSPIG